MERKIEIHDLTTDELRALIHEVVSKSFEMHSGIIKRKNEYISRQDVASLFKITLATVDSWGRKGSLKPYRIGNRVFFKLPEVEKALKAIKY